MKVGDLKKYKDGLYKSLSRDLDAFEKNFLYISAGVLTFSITFIKDIVKINEALYLPILFIGWALILIAIVLMMITFLSSANRSFEIWKIVDSYLIDNKKFTLNEDLNADEAAEIKDKTNHILFQTKKRLKTFRDCAIISFLLGVLSFSSFIGINLYIENHKDKITIGNSKKSSITIKTGSTETITDDSLIIIKQ